MGEATVKTAGLRILWTALLVLVLVMPTSARAFDFSGGVSMGGFQAGGILPRLAVTPHVAILWRKDNGFLFAVHDLFSILAPVNRAGLGVYNKTSVTTGYAP